MGAIGTRAQLRIGVVDANVTPIRSDEAERWGDAGFVLEAVDGGGRPDLLLARFSGDDGPAIVRSLRTRWGALPIVASAPDLSVAAAVRVLRAGAVDCVPSPPAIDDVRRVARRVRAGQPSGERAAPAAWVGTSPAAEEVRRKIALVAPHDATLLIEGETGTGKDLVARIVHASSPRKSGPFVVCDCSAVVPTLFESELFGHERGAFTGARDRRLGFFEAARGGTLFLDHIEELPAALQPKLLRVLENREITRVGGTQTVATDVRVIAASRISLADAVHQGRFRADLYFRLQTAVLETPPLRARREDLPALVETILDALPAGASVRRVSHEAMRLLVAADWPGNVRELKNVLQRAAALAGHRTIGPNDLPRELRGDDRLEEIDGLVPLAEIERRQILRVLEMAEGNRERAARILGMSRSTFYRRIGELGVPGAP